MTHKEIVQFLLDLRDGFGNTEFNHEKHGDFWNAQLYGTRDRTGILEKFCTKNLMDKYVVKKHISAPFTVKRDDTDNRFY